MGGTLLYKAPLSFIIDPKYPSPHPLQDSPIYTLFLLLVILNVLMHFLTIINIALLLSLGGLTPAAFAGPTASSSTTTTATTGTSSSVCSSATPNSRRKREIGYPWNYCQPGEVLWCYPYPGPCNSRKFFNILPHIAFVAFFVIIHGGKR